LGLGFPGPPAAEAVPLFGGFVPPAATKDAVVPAVVFVVAVVVVLMVVFVFAVVVVLVIVFVFAVVLDVAVAFAVGVVFAVVLAPIAAPGAVELTTTTGPAPCPRRSTRLPPAMTSAPATAAPMSPARVDHAAASSLDHAPPEPETCRRPRTLRLPSSTGAPEGMGLLDTGCAVVPPDALLARGTVGPAAKY
jgi:hypothetical protein